MDFATQWILALTSECGVSSMNIKLLEIENLTVQYVMENLVVKAVSGFSMEIQQGECVGLVGETGAGKTTTALAIMGLVPNPPGKIVGGQIRYNGEDLIGKNKKQMRKIRGSAISMIFQDPMTSLNPVIRVGDQVMEVILLHENLSKADATIKAQKMLEMVGIQANRYEEYPHQFSGGMKQRVMIACALACNPALLIADEPTTALDVTIQAQVLQLIADLKKEFNTAMLMITHDLGVGREVFDRVAVMYAGHIVEKGTVMNVYDNPMHPYTQGLFKSLPNIDIDTDRLEPIPGMMPDPSNLPVGCPFSPRCQYCVTECTVALPTSIEVAPGHAVSCFRFSKNSGDS
jgi:peptide/nickel transport system ATP-binding protein